MEFKGTPGPWISSSYGSQVLTGDSWNTICELEDFAIFENEKSAKIDFPERKIANARLIAASPEMLIALERLCNRYLANRGSKHEFILCITPDGKMSEWEYAKEILKKALGERSKPTDQFLIVEKPIPINTEVLAENYRSKNKDLERGRICRIETYWNNDGSFSKHSYSVRLVRKSNSGNPIILHVGSDKVTPILGEEGGSNG